MARYGAQFGPDITFLGVDRCDGSRPSLALRVDGLRDLRVYDAGDVELYPGDAERSVRDLQAAVHRVTSTGAIPLIVGGDRFGQIGLRGYWPGPETLRWMAEQGMRGYEMTEIGVRGLDECLTEAFGIALSAIARRRVDAADGTTWDPRGPLLEDRLGS